MADDAGIANNKQAQTGNSLQLFCILSWETFSYSVILMNELRNFLNQLNHYLACAIWNKSQHET